MQYKIVSLYYFNRAASSGNASEVEVEEDWSQEESAVNTITALGGRLNPGRPELHEFTKR